VSRTWRRLGGALGRARLSLQLVVFETLLIATVVAGAFLALSVEIRGITKRFVAAELRRAEHEILGFENRSLEQLVWTSSVLTESPTLRAAIETYRLESGPGPGVHAQLLGTIQREVERIASGLGNDLLVVTDEHGRVLAASERRAARPALGDDLAALPVVRRALDPTLPAERSNFGAARFHGEYFQIGCVPIVLQDVPIGVLILGDRLDAVVSKLREAFDGEIVVTADDRVIGSTSSLAEFSPAALPASSNEGTIRLGREDFVVEPLRLGSAPGGGPVIFYLLHSLSPVLGPLNQALRVVFLLYGLLGLVLAGVGAAVVSRSVTAPLRRFVAFMESVAQSGDYTRRFDAGPATADIRTLDASYDRLIASLAQKHSELEERRAELSRANVELTEHVQERERAEEALRASEEQLRQSQKLEAIGTLAGGVAHDFNNLLTVMQSYTELVLHELPRDGRMHDDLEQVKLATVRATALTKQLLAFSRKQVMQPKIIDPNAIVTGVEKMLQRVIGEDIDLRTVEGRPLARVLVDPGQLEQVIMNLAVNARDAMPHGGRLTITTANVRVDVDSPGRIPQMPPGEWVLLSVGDTGTGMDAATRARIFEPFFTTKEAGKGTGLGLSTVYGIVKQSGGFITVASEPGQGTTFSIYFPPVADGVTEVDNGAASPGGRTGRGRGGSETILVVEDEESVRSLVRRALEEMGYHVLTADRAEEAERQASRHVGPIHLLVTDVIMPGATGRELRDRLVPRHPGMRVLFISGYTGDAITQRGVLGPGFELLEKPFTPAALGDRVREILER
jgi:signal transduction histidine kinase